MSLPQGENIEEALNREVAEEMGEGNPLVTPEDWLESCFCPGEKILLHFYCKELSEAEFCKFEKRGLQAPEYGVEVLGLVRCGSLFIVLFIQIEYSQIVYISFPFLTEFRCTPDPGIAVDCQCF